MQTPNAPIRYIQVSPGKWENNAADVIVETPVALTVNGEVWLSFMCTPIDLEAMAVGFLFNEGIIHNPEEIADVRLCAAGDNVDVWLHHKAEKPDQWRRTSGCTGGVTAVQNVSNLSVQKNGGILSAHAVGDLINQLFENQQLYRTSGGVHTSALSDGQNINILCEDIGRHNTLDKIAGRVLLEGITLPRRIILTTGRISSEMLQKSARLSAAIVISRTSPSSLSIQLADQLGITLIGYARRNRFNIYSHPERIMATENEPEANVESIF